MNKRRGMTALWMRFIINYGARSKTDCKLCSVEELHTVQRRGAGRNILTQAERDSDGVPRSTGSAGVRK